MQELSFDCTYQISLYHLAGDKEFSGPVFCRKYFFFKILKMKILPTWRYLIVMTNWEEFFSWFTLSKHKNFNLGKFTTKNYSSLKNGPYSAVHTPVTCSFL